MSTSETSTPCDARCPDKEAIAHPSRKKKWYLLVANPSKTTHLGTLLRCAAAFQVHQVLLVGHDKFNCQGSFGSHLFLDILVFPTWESVNDYLRNGGDVMSSDCRAVQDADAQQDPSTNNHTSNPVTTIGILGAYGGGDVVYSSEGAEVHEDEGYSSLMTPKCSADKRNLRQPNTSYNTPQRSFPISTRPFSTDVCFLLSKDKRGLPTSQARMCSGFVHVPHLSFDSGESITQSTLTSEQEATKVPLISQSSLIDTATALSIVLHHFTAWAGYTERTFEENQKFVKDIKPNVRRRLCQVVGQSKEENDRDTNEIWEQEEMNSTMMWNQPGSQTGDY